MKQSVSSRRNFLKRNSMAGLGALLVYNLGCTNAGSADSKKGPVAPEGTKPITTVAGMPLDQLRDWYHAELFDRFLPNMDKSVVDHEYGGFMCTVDIRTGEVLGTTKRAWYEGRGIWVYSYLYNNLEKNPDYIKVAGKSKDFILKNQPSGNDFWNGSFSRDGNPLSGPGDIYGSLFVAEGLAEYAKATGEHEYRVMAKKIALSCLDRYDQPDYHYHMSYLRPTATDYAGPRVLGHWMIFLRLATQMLEIEPDADMEKLAMRCTDAIMNYHLNPEINVLISGLNHDMTFRKDEFEYFSQIGHGIETLWMVMAEALRRKDDGLFNKAADLFKRHVTIAHDDVYGGYFDSLKNINTYEWGVEKVLWLMEEVMTGAMILMEHKADPWAEKVYSETLAYVKDKFSYPSYKFWTETGDRKVNNIQMNRAEHYHHPRHLMIGLMALDRMISKGGKASG